MLYTHLKFIVRHFDPSYRRRRSSMQGIVFFLRNLIQSLLVRRCLPDTIQVDGKVAEKQRRRRALSRSSHS
jgi:hypothetical protein